MRLFAGPHLEHEETERTLQEESGEDDAADEDDSELAWENLAAARGIYEACNANQLDIANVCLRMGDASVLSRNYARAVAEYSKCVEVREGFCEPHERSLAEVYASLANAYGFLGDDHFDNTLTFRRKAIVCLDSACEEATAALKTIASGAKDAEGRTEEELKATVNELQDIVSELKEEVRAAAAGVLGRKNAVAGVQKRKAESGHAAGPSRPSKAAR